jgi:hypothetical protein
MVATCKLCKKDKELLKSHIIPNSFFKKIKKNGESGKAYLIKVKDNAENFVLTQDSGAERMLCQDCEQLLSSNYEKYAIEVMKEMHGKISHEKLGIKFSNVDVSKICLFFASIIWRGFHSNHKYYSELVLPQKYKHSDFEGRLRKSLLYGFGFPAIDLSTRVLKIMDYEFGYTKDAINDFITFPQATDLQNKKVFDFVLHGYWVQCFLPGFSIKQRRIQNILAKKESSFFSPYIEIKNDYRLARACGVKC